ncbi:hypothetical protein AV530_002246 [Patagioenas fasciata monilis]|uniref:Uncharacterized protein n=1 Tax=Patagioenas fasciata monilis TaxID=372326 RepID=A0A1V4K5L6_PATFA|nr:hypothetical protein AV530_002246 [Patagioenas fasciata monilis]
MGECERAVLGRKKSRGKELPPLLLQHKHWKSDILHEIPGNTPDINSLSIRATKCGVYLGVIRFHSLRQFSSKIIKEISNQGYFGEKKIKSIVEIYTDSAPEDITW